MPSPFPGMDPYLETPDLWPDFHARLVPIISDLLTPKLRPRYLARVEQTTFVFGPDDPASELYVVPDVRVIERDPPSPRVEDNGGGVAVAVPIDVTGFASQVARHRYLEIRDAASRRVVTVIEVLSPSNKVENAAGRQMFLRKREQVGQSDTSWLEIDLLRRGTRSVNFAVLPRSAYLAYAERTVPRDAPVAGRDDRAYPRRQLAWPIRLRERLPALPVPLMPGDPDVPLDLQAAVTTAYDRAAYDLEFDYAGPPASALDEADARWADGLLREKGFRR